MINAALVAVNSSNRECPADNVMIELACFCIELGLILGLGHLTLFLNEFKLNFDSS